MKNSLDQSSLWWGRARPERPANSFSDRGLAGQPAPRATLHHTTSVKLAQDSIEHTSYVNLVPLPLLDLDQNCKTDRWHRDVYKY